MFIFIPLPGSGAGRFVGKVRARLWKEYACVACGGRFQSLSDVSQTIRGKTAEEAEERARSLAIKAVNERVEVRPCPNCGCYQPDAETTLRITKIEPFFFLPLSGMVLTFLAMPAQLNPWLWLLGATVIVVGLSRLMVLAKYNINRDPRAARAKAEEFVKAEVVRMVSPGADPDSVAGTMPHADLSRPRLPFVLMIVGAVLFVAADVGLWASGAAINPDCRPVVVGPGDEITLYSPKSIFALRRQWNACATVHILNAGELGLSEATLPARSKTDEWGSQFSGEHLSNDPVFPWVEYTVPDSPTLVGRTLQIEADLEVIYPQLNRDQRSFNEISRSISFHTSTTLSVPGAGARQTKLWWAGTIGGGATMLSGMLMLMLAARGMKRRAPQPMTVIADGPADMTP